MSQHTTHYSVYEKHCMKWKTLGTRYVREYENSMCCSMNCCNMISRPDQSFRKRPVYGDLLKTESGYVQKFLRVINGEPTSCEFFGLVFVN